MGLDKTEVTEMVGKTARMICAEQPDVAEPESIRDLDSFSFVQIVLELENVYDVKLLEGLEGFDGDEFADLADVIIEQAARSPQEA